MQWQDLMTVESARESVISLGSRRVEVDPFDVNPHITEDGELFLQAEGRHWPVSKEGVTSFQKLTDLKPRNFAVIADNPVLLGDVIRHVLAKRERKGLSFVISGDHIREVFPQGRFWIPPLEVFDLAVAVAPQREHLRVQEVGYSRRTAQTQGTGMTFRLVSAVSQVPPRRAGDPSFAGILVNSNGSIQSSPYVFRLVCTNGLESSWDHVVESQDYTQDNHVEILQGFLSSKYALAQDLLQRFVSLDEVTIRNPVSLVLRAANEYNLGSRRLRDVVEVLPTLGDDPTAYDVVNMVTSLANREEAQNDDWQRFGFFVQMMAEEERCFHCGAELRG